MSTDPRYPIGKFSAKESYTPRDLAEFLDRIESLPQRMEIAVKGMTDTQLDTPYRDGGWTVRQVVHHVADSHANAYIRVKWALTEESPIIKPYDEKGWANTYETTADPTLSLVFLKALHAKWMILLKGLTEADRARTFIHPATQKIFTIEQLIAMYAWHGDHHVAHIAALKARMHWS